MLFTALLKVTELVVKLVWRIEGRSLTLEGLHGAQQSTQFKLMIGEPLSGCLFVVKQFSHSLLCGQEGHFLILYPGRGADERRAQCVGLLTKPFAGGCLLGLGD